MRKSYRILIVIAFLASNTAHADLNLKLYAELNLSYDWMEHGDDDWQSNVTRLGLKGEYNIKEDWDVIFQAEELVDPIHGGNEIQELFGTRNTFIGIGSRYGNFMFGAHDSAFKMAQGKIDLFNDQAGDIGVLFPGEVRALDTYFYHSPKASGFQGQVMYVPSDSNFSSSQSASVLWDTGDWFASFGLDHDMRKNNRSTASTKVFDSYRSAIQYTPGAWKFGFLVQRSRPKNESAAGWEAGYLGSVSYTVGSVTLMAQHGESDIYAKGITSDNLGIHYNFTRKRKVYLYYWDYNTPTDREILSLGFELKF